MEMYDLVIIGSGIGGVASYIYAKRAGLNVELISDGVIGGQIWNTSTIDNFIGLPNTTAEELNKNLEKQLLDYGKEPLYGKVMDIEVDSDGEGNNIFTLKTDMEDVIKSKSVIVATGTTHNKLGVVGEYKFSYTGVSYCAICDGNLYEGKEVVVVGGGDSAVEGAIYLSKIAKKVHIVIRRDKFRASENLVKTMLEIKNIEVVKDSEITRICGDDYVKMVKIKNKYKNHEETIFVEGVFIYVGTTPNTKFLEDLDNKNNNILLNKDKEVIVETQKMATKVRGLYAIGDVRSGSYRQLGIAVGDGITASLSIQDYLNE